MMLLAILTSKMIKASSCALMKKQVNSSGNLFTTNYLLAGLTTGLAKAFAPAPWLKATGFIMSATVAKLSVQTPRGLLMVKTMA